MADTASALESITPSEFMDAFADFLKEYNRERIEEILANEDDGAPHSVSMCMQYLLDHNPTLGTMLLQHPTRLMSLANQAIAKVQQEWLDSDAYSSSSQHWSLKEKVYCRIQYMPPIPQLCKPNISCLRSTDVGGLLEVSGTVIRTGTVKLLERNKTYVCGSSRCKHKFTVSADLMQGNILIPPTACPSSSSGNLCKSTTFQLLEEETKACDYQEIKIQEQVQNLAVGSIPRSIVVVLVDDLVDSCKPGDDVVVVGLMIRRWQPCYPQVLRTHAIVVRCCG
jgi:DNA helicase MCM9